MSSPNVSGLKGLRMCGILFTPKEREGGNLGEFARCDRARQSNVRNCKQIGPNRQLRVENSLWDLDLDQDLKGEMGELL